MSEGRHDVDACHRAKRDLRHELWSQLIQQHLGNRFDWIYKPDTVICVQDALGDRLIVQMSDCGELSRDDLSEIAQNLAERSGETVLLTGLHGSLAERSVWAEPGGRSTETQPRVVAASNAAVIRLMQQLLGELAALKADLS